MTQTRRLAQLLRQERAMGASGGSEGQNLSFAEESRDPGGLREQQWEDLLDLIDKKRCTPVIGAGASAPTMPLAAKLAAAWSQRYNYPLKDSWNLSRVAQYMAVKRYGMFPKEEMRQEIIDCGEPSFDKSDSPHGMLADLKLPVYITTNYDDFMAQAVRSRDNDPRVEYCRWNEFDQAVGARPARRQLPEPSPAQPLVYHLHGHRDHPEYMVLTEEDYLHFLLRISEPKDSRQRQQSPLLPPPVLKALASNALLFVGYSLTDWTFRLLLRGLNEGIRANLGMPSIAIQLPPEEVVDGRETEARQYLQHHLGLMGGAHVSVYWGRASQFAEDLVQRRKERHSDGF